MLTNGLGVEIKFNDKNDFLKIKETLTRVGIASKKDKKLYQSVHILHKKNQYFLMHFKELFALDGKETSFTNEDKARRNTITSLLEEWKLLTVLNPDQIKEPRATLSNIKIISFKEKAEWTLESKYTIGKIKGKPK